jgi:hypothetical protein
MSRTSSPSAKKVQDSLNARGFDCQVVELPTSTRTVGSDFSGLVHLPDSWVPLILVPTIAPR